MQRRTDILFLTYRSSDYLHKSLPALLDSCGEQDRVWLWHNGDDEATLDSLQQYRKDERVSRFHHSRENVGLREPTRWLWANSQATYVSKVDDDCVELPEWIETLARAHDANPQFGVIATWRGQPDDFQPEIAEWKIHEFRGGHRLMRNLWVQGSGYLLRRSYVERIGTLTDSETFTDYCIRVAREGGVNGFYYPFIHEDHMDDPRSKNTLISSDRALQDRMPLSAKANGVTSAAQWEAQLRRSATILQTAPLSPGRYLFERRMAGLRRRLLRKKAMW